ncbi:MAG: hypothetical protein HY282_14525 [Nitrospirae bacterium]|nr:hypothetical protein [Candidatus Manganitrophaceae bacterium]
MNDPSRPWDLSFHGVEEISTLRKKLLHIEALKDPSFITVRGTLYPCALLSSGWWERESRAISSELEWKDRLQKWLFIGFDLWGPSWDFSWDFDTQTGGSRSHFIAQIGEGDEANSLPVIIPCEKAKKLREKFKEGWGGVEVNVRGLLGHRHQFAKEPGPLGLVGGLLDYCLWLNEEDKEHKITLLADKTEIYSGYLWKCMVPKKWFEANKSLCLSDVYFLWEHTNFTEKDAIRYNLDSLARKEEYVRSLQGELILLQKSSSLVPGEPLWSTEEFYGLLTRKKGEEI